MKKLEYKFRVNVPAADRSLETKSYLQEKIIFCPDEKLKENLAIAQSEADTGEVSVEYVGAKQNQTDEPILNDREIAGGAV